MLCLSAVCCGCGFDKNLPGDCCLQIALELDQQERAFMAEGGMESEDYLKYMAEESGNVAADGNFSVQVCVELQQT